MRFIIQIHTHFGPGPPFKTLKSVLDSILDPHNKIDINGSFELIEWVKWLMTGDSPEEFTANVRIITMRQHADWYGQPTLLPTDAEHVGYPIVMSHCAECFRRGNHTGPEFNMFRISSQAGGTCDCVDLNVIKESSFCYLHGPHSQHTNMSPPNTAPPDLLYVASQMMPRLILRLIHHTRENSNSTSGFLGSVQDADGFITMLHAMSGMGADMRQVMTYALTNPQIYKNVTDIEEIESSMNPAYYEYMCGSKAAYKQALSSLPNPKPLEEYSDIPALQQDLIHHTFLEEFVFWTAKKRVSSKDCLPSSKSTSG